MKALAEVSPQDARRGRLAPAPEPISGAEGAWCGSPESVTGIEGVGGMSRVLVLTHDGNRDWRFTLQQDGAPPLVVGLVTSLNSGHYSPGCATSTKQHGASSITGPGWRSIMLSIGQPRTPTREQ